MTIRWLNPRDKGISLDTVALMAIQGLGLNCSTSSHTVASAASASTLCSNVTISLIMTRLTRDSPQLYLLYLNTTLSRPADVKLSCLNVLWQENLRMALKSMQICTVVEEACVCSSTSEREKKKKSPLMSACWLIFSKKAVLHITFFSLWIYLVQVSFVKWSFNDAFCLLFSKQVIRETTHW